MLPDGGRELLKSDAVAFISAAGDDGIGSLWCRSRRTCSMGWNVPALASVASLNSFFMLCCRIIE